MDVYEKATGMSRWSLGFIALRELLLTIGEVALSRGMPAMAGVSSPTPTRTWVLCHGVHSSHDQRACRGEHDRRWGVRENAWCARPFAFRKRYRCTTLSLACLSTVMLLDGR